MADTNDRNTGRMNLINFSKLVAHGRYQALKHYVYMKLKPKPIAVLSYISVSIPVKDTKFDSKSLTI